MSEDKKGKKGEAAASGMQMCNFKGCKQTVSKFSFCAPHFDQFKFGLITKNGDAVPDFDKKFDQFQKMRANRKTA